MLDSHTTLACHPRLLARALLRATLVALLIAGAVTALPAVAQASDNDFFVNAVRINTPGTTLGSFSEAHDNIGATTEDGENGPFTQCATVFYGATVWYWFFPHVNGRVHVTVTTSGAFDPVASVIRWTGNGVTEAFLEDGLCNGPIPGLNRTDVPINGFVPVSAGQQYAVQVGGAKSPNTAGGTAGTGDYSVFFDYDPDSDGDGLFDSEDQCDSEAGPAIHAGCPDNDGDGIPNRSDSCVNLAGGPTYQGCPDADGDKVPEGGQDHCEGLNPERVNRADRKPRDGCPDNLRILTNTKQLVAPSGNGILIGEFFVTGVPKGARVQVKCKRPNGSSCGKMLVKRAAVATALGGVRAKATRRLAIHKRLSETLPYGSTITVRVTAPFAIGRFIRIRVVPGKLISKQFLCIKPGTKKPRRKGCG